MIKSLNRDERLKREFDDFLLVHPSDYFSPLKDYLTKHYDLSNKKILEFGCGTGGMLPSLLKEGPSELIGIDTSKKAIQYAVNNSPTKIKYICGDIGEMKDTFGSYDFIVSNSALQYVDNIDQVFKTLHRKLIRGGVLFATIEIEKQTSLINIMQFCGLYFLPACIKRRLYFIWKFLPGRKSYFNQLEVIKGKTRYLCIPVVNWVDRTILENLLGQAGFTNYKISDAPKLHELSRPHYLIEART